MRNDFARKNVKVTVVKNTLARRALEDARRGRDSDVFFGRCHTLADLGLIDQARVQQLDAQVTALMQAHYGAPHA